MYKVILSVGTPVCPYTGLERVFALTGLRYRNYVNVLGIYELPNTSSNPSTTFSVYRVDLESRTNSLIPPEKLLGFAHTHPNNRHERKPSWEDIEGIRDSHIGLVMSGKSLVFYNSKGIEPHYLLE